MKRKDYEKPTMKVVQLRHQTQLLTVSGVTAVRKSEDKETGELVPDYGEAVEETWGEE
jgi:hypothetical protein